MAKQFIDSDYKMKGISATDLALVCDRFLAIADDVENETGDVDLAKDIKDIVQYLQNQSTSLVIEKEQDGCIYNVAQVLIKGDDYEIACPDNEDVWYDYDDISCSTNQEDLERIIGEHKLQLLKDGKINYVVVRGDW